MQIIVSLFATFRNGRFKQEERIFPDGATLGQVIVDIGIAAEEIGMALVNGRHAPLDRSLSGGDTIALFPMLGGG